jgi:hypothetical protein
MLIAAATAGLIALSASPMQGPPGYSYEGMWPSMDACVKRAAFLERNYNVQAFECSIYSSDNDPSRDLWVLWG